METENNTPPRPEYIYFRESFLQSVLSDAFSIGTTVALLFLNRFYLGDRTLIVCFALLLFAIIVISKGMPNRHTFTSIAELKKWAAELES